MPTPKSWRVAVGCEGNHACTLAPKLTAALREFTSVLDVHRGALVMAPTEAQVTAMGKHANAEAASTGALDVPFPWAERAGGASAGGCPSSDVVWLLVERARLAARGVGNVVQLDAASAVTKEGVIEPELVFVPLADAEESRKCWSAAASWRVLVDPAPFREAMGHEVALYLEFMAHYCKLLAVPAVLSVAPYLLRVYAHTTALHPIYALVCVFWAVLFVQHWQRRQSDVAREGGLLCDGTALDSVDVGGMRDYFVPVLRKEFVGTERINPVSGIAELWFPSWRRKFVLRPLAWLGVAAYLVPCLCLQLLSINLQGYMIHDHATFLRVDVLAEWADPGQPFDPNGDGFLYLLPVTLHVSCVLMLGILFKSVAERLTGFENHRTEEEHKLALVQKRVAFEFVDCYFLLFFVAFFLQDMNQLRSEFASIFAVDQFRRLFLEAVVPWLMHWFAGGRKKSADAGTLKAEVAEAFAKDEYEPFDDYLEMVVQFGYVAMFASAFPLAATLSWLGNLVEVRADAFKLCFVNRRPLPERAAAAKPWTGVLHLFATAAVVVNCLLIGVTSAHQLDAYLPDGFNTRKDRLLCGLGLEHLMGAAVVALRWAVPSVPGATHNYVDARVVQRQKQAA